jgi:DnaJ-class molecular chaperone
MGDGRLTVLRCWQCNGTGRLAPFPCRKCETTGHLFWSDGAAFPYTPNGEKQAIARLDGKSDGGRKHDL